MQLHFATALVFAIFAFLFIFVTLFAGRFLRPARPSPVKSEAYECGEVPIGSPWINYNLRFYIIALVFVIFDVEAALIFPVVAVYKGWLDGGTGVIALAEILIFVAILIVGLAYIWGKGDLEWIKRVTKNAQF